MDPTRAAFIRMPRTGSSAGTRQVSLADGHAVQSHNHGARETVECCPVCRAIGDPDVLKAILHLVRGPHRRPSDIGVLFASSDNHAPDCTVM